MLCPPPPSFCRSFSFLNSPLPLPFVFFFLLLFSKNLPLLFAAPFEVKSACPLVFVCRAEFVLLSLLYVHGAVLLYPFLLSWSFFNIDGLVFAGCPQAHTMSAWVGVSFGYKMGSPPSFSTVASDFL